MSVTIKYLPKLSCPALGAELSDLKGYEVVLIKGSKLVKGDLFCHAGNSYSGLNAFALANYEDERIANASNEEYFILRKK